MTKKMTLEELREETGIAAARLVRKYREGVEVDGQTIQMEEVEGGRLWWLKGDGGADVVLDPVSEPKKTGITIIEQGEVIEEESSLIPEAAADEPTKQEIEDATKKEEHVYTTHHLVSESHIHGRTTGGLEAAGLFTVQDILDEIEDKGCETNAIKHLSSSKFNGVGKAGAKDTVRWALRMANYEAREFFSSYTEPDGEPEVQSAYPPFVYELVPGDVAPAKQMVDAVRNDQLVPGPLMTTEGKAAFEAWVASLDSGIDIFCPHCGGLWDSLPDGENVHGGRALCENMDGVEGRGDCGENFWIAPTDEGYETFKSDPEELKKNPKEEAPKEEEHVVKATLVNDEFVAVEDSTPIEGLTEETNPEPPEDWSSEDWIFGGEWATEEDWTTETPTRNSLPFDDRVHPMLPECKLLARTEAHSDDWHKARAKGVGSSDAGAVLGLSPYATPVDAWKSKIGAETDSQPWLEEYSEFGTWFEPHLREWVELEYGIEIIDGADLGTLQSIQWPHALANIDGLDTTTGALEEYKTTTEKWAVVPMQYEAQVQHQMYVTGAMVCRLRQFVCPIDRAHLPALLKRMRNLAILEEDADEELAAYLFDIGTVHTWIIERDDAYIERLIEAEKTFWDFVQIEVEPPEQDPDGTVDLSTDPEVVAACEEYARLNGVYESAVEQFIKAERIPTEGRGSLTGKAEKALKAARKKARNAIKRAIALHPEEPKRVVMGTH